MRKTSSIVLCFLFALMTLGADPKQEIAKQGDNAWEELLSSANNDHSLIDPPTDARTIARKFNKYKGSLMLFPGFSFEDFVTDRNGEKYYYYGEDEGNGLFIIKYDEQITEMLRKYSYAMGPVGDQGWELLGSIEESFEWWGDIILMEIKAVRIQNKITVIKNGDSLDFVGQNLIDNMMNEKAAAGITGVPENLTSIPSGLEPRTVADLYVHIANKEQNQEVWLQLLSSYNFYAGKPERRVDSWWTNLTKPERTFFFVRVATDEPTTKKYFYQIRENGNDVGSPKPMTLVLEDNEWKVKSGF
jgi:hypothetical protein